MSLLVTNCGQIVGWGPSTGSRRGREMGSPTLIRDGAIAIEHGMVTWVGDLSDAPGATRVLDAKGGVVTPGLVDCHSHLIFGGHRGADLEQRAQGMDYAQISASGGGILHTMRETRKLSDSEMVTLGERRLAQALSTGTTTIEAKSGYGLDFETEVRVLRAYRELARKSRQTVVSTYLALHAVPPEAPDKREFVARVCSEWVPAVAREGLAGAVDAFVEPGYFSAHDARALAAAAHVAGISIRLHADQFGDHGGAALAAELGATTVDHLEHTGTKGISALSASATIPVLLPSSVLGLGLSKYAEGRAMVDAGLPVAIATDFNPGSSPNLSLPLTMGLCCRYMGMSPAEALCACTVNGAEALGLPDRGRLVAGERADLAVWGVSDYREIPTYFGVPTCAAAIVAGEIVYVSPSM